MAVKTTGIYIVHLYDAKWNETRACANAAEAARCIFADLPAGEQKCISIEELESLIKGLKVGCDHNIFDRRVTKRTLFG